MGRQEFHDNQLTKRTRPTLNWQQFVETVRSLPGRWIYRGGLEHWEHETSLERTCRAWKIPLRFAATVEQKLVREFQRHPEVRGHLVDPQDYLAWLALMQHHGAPTRLLDWTYSPYVAAYFAFEALLLDRSEQEALLRATIWALDVDWLEDRIRRRLSARDWKTYKTKKDGNSFKALFVDRKPRLRFIGTATPRMLNERLSIQQGVFLCPGDVTTRWAANLAALGSPRTRPRVKTFSMTRDTMETAFRELASMNVTARTLFPGIDGYAKSIAVRTRQLWKTPLLSQ